MISSGNVLATARIVYTARKGYPSCDSDVTFFTNNTLKENLAKNSTLSSWRLKKQDELVKEEEQNQDNDEPYQPTAKIRRASKTNCRLKTGNMQSASDSNSGDGTTTILTTITDLKMR